MRKKLLTNRHQTYTARKSMALPAQTLLPSDQLVIIDEIQKLPELMDKVHLLIERHKQLRFILTGSSARTLKPRNLKQNGVNLLAGRAWKCRLHPLVSHQSWILNASKID